MTRFLDGPAAGVTLCLRRSPLFLRVVRGPNDAWDALDQPGDVPACGEALFAYRRKGKPGSVHVRAQKPAPSGWFCLAKYELVDPQPDDSVMRSRPRWEAWASAEFTRLKWEQEQLMKQGRVEER